MITAYPYHFTILQAASAVSTCDETDMRATSHYCPDASLLFLFHWLSTVSLVAAGYSSDQAVTVTGGRLSELGK